MMFTKFANKFTKKTGILELMDDLGKAMDGRTAMRMLGGGNPAHIPEVNALWRDRMNSIMANGAELEESLANYDTPQGKHAFLEAVARLLSDEYGWDIGPENVAITNGSQTAFFLMLNLFAGVDDRGVLRKMLFPMCPEYIGYADQGLTDGSFVTCPSLIEETRPHYFKYHVDFVNLPLDEDVAAMCVSRPTNPTGNVLTDEEVKKLADIAVQRDIPLIVDNAYGAPFPHILFREVNPYWDKHIVLSMSLSKLGLPSTRTGIIVADKPIIDAVAACNAVISLSNGTLGQVLVRPLIDSGEILRISREVIRPFYEQRSLDAIAALQEAFGDDIDYRIHESEGALFLWLWLPHLPISSAELYERLKTRGVLVVSGHYFFYGLEEKWDHGDQCLRLSYAQDPVKFREAAFLMADEVRAVMKEQG